MRSRRDPSPDGPAVLGRTPQASSFGLVPSGIGPVASGHAPADGTGMRLPFTSLFQAPPRTLTDRQFQNARPMLGKLASRITLISLGPPYRACPNSLLEAGRPDVPGSREHASVADAPNNGSTTPGARWSVLSATRRTIRIALMVSYGMKPTPSLVSVPIEALPHQRRGSLRSARVGLVAPFCAYLRVRPVLNEKADDAGTGILGDALG